MYKYKIVKIKRSIWTGKLERPMEDIIEQYSENGWRLVQVHELSFGCSGGSSSMKIIFEKPMEQYVEDVRRHVEIDDLV